MQKIVEKQQDHFNKIQEAKEKLEQQKKEEIEKLRQEHKEKELLAEKKRESQIMARKETLNKHILRVNSGRMREKEMQG